MSDLPLKLELIPNRQTHRIVIGTDTSYFIQSGRDTTIGYESIYYLTQEQYDDAVIGGKVRISLKGK